MSWFKKDNYVTPEVCGYLDKEGNFYKDKLERDVANYRIAQDDLKSELDSNVREFIFRNGHFTPEVSQCLDLIDKYLRRGSVTDLVEIYVKYWKSQAELEKTLGK